MSVGPLQFDEGSPALPPRAAWPVPPPPFADPKKQHENAKRDARRREGAAALRAVKAPPQNSATDPVPQMPAPGPPPQYHAPTAPVPQYTPPSYSDPQYHAPKKGLEYLALGLGLLFPGAPIANLAGHFAGGLSQGAEQRYERDAHKAQQQYQVARDQSQATYGNQQNVYNAAQHTADERYQHDRDVYGAQTDAAKIAFQNAQLRWSAQQDLRSRGINPKTNQPFVLPPTLAAPPDPKVGNVGYANWHRDRQAFYAQVGATALSQEEAQQAADYVKRALDDQNNARALMIANMHIQSSWAQLGVREAATDAREQRREAFELFRDSARDVRTDTKHLGVVREQSATAAKGFYEAWARYTRPGSGVTHSPGGVQLDEFGQPVKKGTVPPAALSAQEQAVLAKTFQRIDRDSDPIAMARYYSEQMQTLLAVKPAVSELLAERGKMADLARQSQGLPILPHAMPKALDVGNLRALVERAKAAGLDPSDPQVRAAILRDFHDAVSPTAGVNKNASVFDPSRYTGGSNAGGPFSRLLSTPPGGTASPTGSPPAF